MYISIQLWPPRIRVNVPTPVYVAVSVVALASLATVAYGHISGTFDIEISHSGVQMHWHDAEKQAVQPPPQPNSVREETAKNSVPEIQQPTTVPATPVVVPVDVPKPPIKKAKKREVAKPKHVKSRRRKMTADESEYGYYYSWKVTRDEDSHTNFSFALNRCVYPDNMPIACYMPKDRRKDYPEILK